jgi:hypothetical protein
MGEYQADKYRSDVYVEKHHINKFGREYWRYTFAGMAMQEMLATVDNNYDGYADYGAPEAIAKAAVRYADALLWELEGKDAM